MGKGRRGGGVGSPPTVSPFFRPAHIRLQGKEQPERAPGGHFCASWQLRGVCLCLPDSHLFTDTPPTITCQGDSAPAPPPPDLALSAHGSS